MLLGLYAPWFQQWPSKIQGNSLQYCMWIGNPWPTTYNSNNPCIFKFVAKQNSICQLGPQYLQEERGHNSHSLPYNVAMVVWYKFIVTWKLNIFEVFDSQFEMYIDYLLTPEMRITHSTNLLNFCLSNHSHFNKLLK